jgi:oxygen-independent coproporphyrinogen-3 oxidase
MGLRLAEGIDPGALADRLGVGAVVDERAVARLEKLSLLRRAGAQLAVTPPGRLLLDSILGEIAA